MLMRCQTELRSEMYPKGATSDHVAMAQCQSLFPLAQCEFPAGMGDVEHCANFPTFFLCLCVHDRTASYYYPQNSLHRFIPVRSAFEGVLKIIYFTAFAVQVEHAWQKLWLRQCAQISSRLPVMLSIVSPPPCRSIHASPQVANRISPRPLVINITTRLSRWRL